MFIDNTKENKMKAPVKNQYLFSVLLNHNPEYLMS